MNFDSVENFNLFIRSVSDYLDTDDGSPPPPSMSHFTDSEGNVITTNPLKNGMSVFDFVSTLIEMDSENLEDALEDVCPTPTDGIYSIRLIGCDHRISPMLAPEFHCIIETSKGFSISRFWIDDSVKNTQLMKDCEVCDDVQLFTLSQEDGRELYEQIEALFAMGDL